MLVAPVASPRPAGGGPVLAERAARGAATSWRATPGPRALVWLLGVEALAIGALDVLTVVLAVSVLDLGDGGGAGFLVAAIGAGGVVGSLASTMGSSAGAGSRRRCSRGLALWSAGLAAIAPHGLARGRVPPARGRRRRAHRPSTSPAGRCCSASPRRRRSHACSACSKA